jgi:hypothetical protein
MQNEVNCNFFRWHDEEKGEDEAEVRKPDLVLMKMWQELAVERSREIEKLQSKLEEANFHVAAEKSMVVAESMKVAAERSKMKLAMFFVVLSWTITTALIFSNVM